MSDQNLASGHSHFADIVHDGMREQGVPEKYVRLVKDTYEDARTQV